MSMVQRLPVLAVFTLAAVGCGGGGLGALGDILTAGAGGQGGGGLLLAEVQEVRTQQQQILVRTEDGQQGAVLYDQNTQVIYQNQQYPVNALERGDVVEMRLHEVQQGLYTDLIEVRQSVQERQGGTTGGTAANVHRLEGTIDQIDVNRNMFMLNMTQGGALSVYLPSSASTTMRNRLRDYRSGDYVRVEVRAVSETQAELIRWGWSS